MDNLAVVLCIGVFDKQLCHCFFSLCVEPSSNVF